MGNYLGLSGSGGNSEDNCNQVGTVNESDSLHDSFSYRRSGGAKRKQVQQTANDDFDRTVNLMLQAASGQPRSSINSSNSSPRSTGSFVNKTKSSFYNRVVSGSFSSSPANVNNKNKSPNKSKSQLISEEQQNELLMPHRKKMRSTSQYIYNALFVNGEGSDVSMRALGKEWRLHKV
jgi:hypothetical protein